MLRPLGADGKVHKTIKEVDHLGKQPKEGGDDAAEKPKKNVNHVGVVRGVVVVTHVKKLEEGCRVDCELGKEVEVDCKEKAVDGSNSDCGLFPFPQRARTVRLLCTRVRSLLQEVEHAAATPFQALKLNTVFKT